MWTDGRGRVSSRHDSFGRGASDGFVQSPCYERMDFLRNLHISLSDVLLAHPNYEVSPEDFGWDSSEYFLTEVPGESGGGAQSGSAIPGIGDGFGFTGLPNGFWRLRFHIKGFAETVDPTLEAKDRNSTFILGLDGSLLLAWEGTPQNLLTNYLNAALPGEQSSGVLKIDRILDVHVQANSTTKRFPAYSVAASPGTDMQNVGSIGGQRVTFASYPSKFVGGLTRRFGRVHFNIGRCRNIGVNWNFDIAQLQELEVSLNGVFPDEPLGYSPPSAPTFGQAILAPPTWQDLSTPTPCPPTA